MADYNIYIHAFSGGSSATTPFQLKEGGGDSKVAEFIKKGASFAADPDSAVSSVANTAVGTLSKISPWVAAAIFVTGVGIKVSAKVYETYVSYKAASSGDDTSQIKYNNFKTALQGLFSPFQTIINVEKEKLNVKISDLKAEQQRLLVGPTIYDRSSRYL